MPDRPLQQMFDVPVPRPHAGKKSRRLTARPWEAASGETTQPQFTRAQRRAMERHVRKHHAH